MSVAETTIASRSSDSISETKTLESFKNPALWRSILGELSPRHQTAGAVMVGGIVVLLIAQLAFVRPAIERKLIKRAQGVLVLDGTTKAVTISASGRDLSLSGYAASEQTRARAIDLVRGRRGVRTVDAAKLTVDAGLADAGGILSLDPQLSDGSGVAPRSSDRAAGQGDNADALALGTVEETDNGTDGAANDAALASDASRSATGSALDAERAKPMRRAKIAVHIANGNVLVEGNVASEEGRDQLLGRTRQNLGAQNITDSLVVPATIDERPDLNDYRRVGQLLSILASFPGSDISLSYDRGTLQVTGSVASNDDLALAQGEIRKLVPDAALRDDRLVLGVTAAVPVTTAATTTATATATTTTISA